MARPKVLSEAENEDLRSLAKRLLAVSRSQAALARLLGVSPSSLSGFMGGTHGAGAGLAERLSAMRDAAPAPSPLGASEASSARLVSRYHQSLEAALRATYRFIDGTVGLEAAVKAALAARTHHEAVLEAAATESAVELAAGGLLDDMPPGWYRQFLEERFAEDGGRDTYEHRQEQAEARAANAADDRANAPRVAGVESGSARHSRRAAASLSASVEPSKRRRGQ